MKAVSNTISATVQVLKSLWRSKDEQIITPFRFNGCQYPFLVKEIAVYQSVGHSLGRLYYASIIFLCMSQIFAGPPSRSDLDRAVASGELLFQLTEPAEVILLFGNPEKTEELREGAMTIQLLRYGEAMFAFGKRREEQVPFALLAVEFQGERLEIGQNRKIAPRNERDLAKLDSFVGFRNVSLVRLDLSRLRDLVDRMPYDSATEWPSAEKLPPDFKPELRLRSGLNPGLGLRQLHRDGIDGKGIAIAIIDQPLLRDHVEYRDAIAIYEPMGVDGMSPQMHGPAVASIAVGKNRGVAPGSRLTFFAVPMWKPDNQHYIDAMEKVLELNRTRPAGDRIRVVSISDGAFRQHAHYEEWVSLLKEVEESGIFVVTCDRASLDYGTLVRLPDRDPEDPEGYRSGKHRGPGNVLLVPTGNMTHASQAGPQIYTFDPEGGMSWAAPYLAGLGALAYQANPAVSPSEIRAALISTATLTPAGPVVDPRGFLERIGQKGR